MLSEALPAASVSVNAEKSRKGVFEVRVGGDAVVTTGPEPRPFPALKALDIAEVAAAATAAAASD